MEQNIKDELQLSKAVQQAILGLPFPKHPNISLVAKCIPSKDLGGDFYTFVDHIMPSLSKSSKKSGIIKYQILQKNYIGLAVGDVSGHGVSSALIMSLSSALIANIGHELASPKEVLKKTNNEIHKFISGSPISHVTTLYGIVDLHTKTFIYSNAGHPPALLLRKGKIFELDTTDVFLGVYNDEEFSERVIQLKNNDRLLFYTDGIIEIKDKDDLFFGDIFTSIIEQYADLNSKSLLKRLFEEMNNFTQETFQDDRTLVILDIL